MAQKAGSRGLGAADGHSGSAGTAGVVGALGAYFAGDLDALDTITVEPPAGTLDRKRWLLDHEGASVR